jgi:dihydrofolate synthase/folylpolyglutamate synthase
LNAALAVATVRKLQDRIPINSDAIRSGLMNVSWLGRLQIVKRENQTILLDGAHNPAGAQALRDALEQDFPGVTRTLVLGIMQDKDCKSICDILAPLASRIITCRVSSQRSADPNELVTLCRTVNPAAQISTAPSIEAALGSVADDPFVIVTGSMHFIGHALQVLVPNDCRDERALNEWTGGKTN